MGQQSLGGPKIDVKRGLFDDNFPLVYATTTRNPFLFYIQSLSRPFQTCWISASQCVALFGGQTALIVGISQALSNLAMDITEVTILYVRTVCLDNSHYGRSPAIDVLDDAFVRDARPVRA